VPGAAPYPLIPRVPFSTADWTWVNRPVEADGTTQEVAGTVQLRILGRAGFTGLNNLRLKLKPWPVGKTVVTAGFMSSPITTGKLGLALYETSTEKLAGAHLEPSGSFYGAPYIYGSKFTNPNTHASSYIVVAYNYTPTLNFFRATLTSTTWALTYTTNGVDFWTLYSEALNSHFTTGPTHIGIFGASDNTGPTYGTYFTWVEE
jgi:hypothetical protein